MKRAAEEQIANFAPEPPLAWFWPALGLAVFLTLPYYFSLETFFSHDDFVILWFNKGRSPWAPWVFLQTEVLTFYRPLQDYAFALLYHYSGMIVFPYCFFLVMLHLANIVLFGRLVQRLFAWRPLTLLSVIFFAANWEYWEVVCWKGNYGTALSWLFAMGAANLFADHLQGRHWLRYAGSFALMALALLSKETAANLPLLLSLIYWAGPPRRDSASGGDSAASVGSSPALPPADRGGTPRDFVRLLAPIYLFVGAYALFHVLFVRDVYTWIPKGYEFQGPTGAVAAVFHSMSFWLTSWLRASLQLLAPARMLGELLLWMAHHPFVYYLLPLAAAAAAIGLRDRRLGFGILWAVLAFFPANLVSSYAMERYYYGPLMGVAVILAELLLVADRAILRHRSFRAVAVARVAGCLLILFYVHANMIFATDIVSKDAARCRDIEDLYRFLGTQRGIVPHHTLFLVRCVNQAEHFHEGMGLRELCKLALEDDSVEAILPDQNLADETLRTLLRDYPKPVEVRRNATGRYELRIAVPRPADTATTGTQTP